MVLPQRSAIGWADCTARATVPQVGDLGVEGSRPRVEPADLQQVGEQLLEPVELVVQQLGRPRHRGVEAGARVVDEVGGHPDRRQRGAQLVRHVGDEALLDARESLELADLGLQAVGHLVERLGQPGQVVLAAGPHPFVEPTGREPLRHEGGAADRADDLTGHHPGDDADEEDQRQTADEEGAGDEVEGGLLALHREHGIQVVAPGERRLDLRPDDDGRDLARRLCGSVIPMSITCWRRGSALTASRSAGRHGRRPMSPLDMVCTTVLEVLARLRVSTR